MSAFKCYDDKIVSENTKLFYIFECKLCNERWFGSFCQCPKCKELKKYRILSSELAVQTMHDNREHKMAVYGLLMEYYKK